MFFIKKVFEMVENVEVKIWFDEEENSWVVTIVDVVEEIVSSVENLKFDSKEVALSFVFDFCRKKNTEGAKCDINFPEIIIPNLKT